VTGDYEYNNDHSSFIKVGEIVLADSEEKFSTETPLPLINSDDIAHYVW
jgi:hypothetical protein